MEKRFEDDKEFKKFVREEYIKEADFWENELLAEDDLEEDEMSDEEVKASYEKLKKRLMDDGVYRFNREFRRTGNIRIVRKAYPLSKAALIVFVSAMCVFASSIVSETNIQNFVQRFEYIFALDTPHHSVENFKDR